MVEKLSERGFPVHAINPKQMDRFRDRFTLAGAASALDRGTRVAMPRARCPGRDAEVMASALRTDPRCFRPLAPADPVVVGASRRFGIPANGTLAYSFIQAHNDEVMAFRHFAEARRGAAQ